MVDVPGIKASAHYEGPTVHPDERPSSAGGRQTLGAAEEAAAAAQVAAVVESTNKLVAANFPHVEHTPLVTQSCMYTSTPDHDYILGRAPSAPSVILAGGGSGHAFKMGPALGDCAAALALGIETPLPIERFGVERLLGGSYGQGSAISASRR
uniref:FAD dependent oxidoreductase domain-containing protein n=1 Tax=Coccolithus braarudii TaxID=221442 RepID=A0A7S0LC30_9EUKA